MSRVGRVFKLFAAVISYIRHGRTVVPLLCYFFLKLGIIALYVSSGAGMPGGFGLFLVRGTDAEALGHYPEHLILMPAVLGRLDIPLEILVLVIAQGATVILVAGVLQRRKVGLRESLAGTGRRYTHLIAASAIASAALYTGFRYPVSLLERFLALPRGLGGGLRTLTGLVLATLFLYAIPFILIEGRGAFDAIRRSVVFAGRHFIESFLLVLVPFLLTVPTLLLSLNPEAIAFQVSPEFLVQVQIAGEIMQFIATYLLMGGLTVYFAETRAVEEERRCRYQE
jgi:hypothetical protein